MQLQEQIPKNETPEQKNARIKKGLLLMAETLRNHEGVTQCVGDLSKGDRSFCAMGLLAFKSGVPVTPDDSFSSIGHWYHNYGLTQKEIYHEIWLDATTPSYPTGMYIGSMWSLNDNGYSFDQIADILEKTAERY